MIVIPEPLTPVWTAEAGTHLLGVYGTEQEAVNACAKWLSNSAGICYVRRAYMRDGTTVPCTHNLDADGKCFLCGHETAKGR